MGTAISPTWDCDGTATELSRGCHRVFCRAAMIFLEDCTGTALTLPYEIAMGLSRDCHGTAMELT